MPKISSITCHKILNSRADWTIETQVILDDGSVGAQTIPDGASKGEKEALAVPVDKAIKIVTTIIKDALVGKDSLNQKNIDETLIKLDGTENKSLLGANSILSVSQAVAKAAAMSKKIELWEHLSFLYHGQQKTRGELLLPIPIFNIINGGKHAHNNLSFQEFMVIPAKNIKVIESIEIGATVYNDLQKLLLSKKLDVGVGDEGGFAPNGLTVEMALGLIREAASIHYKPGIDLFFGIDVATESFYTKNSYNIAEETLVLTSDQLQSYYQKLVKEFELIYIEDPFYEKDIAAWKKFTAGSSFMVVGDDLCVTNPKILKNVISQQLANAVIVKPNQIGTVTETLEFIRIAKEAKMSTIISHRSGDTAEDTFIADLAVAVDADFMKAGAPARGERVAKYNRLLEIFSE